MDLCDVGILPQHYTASQPRRPRLEDLTGSVQGPVASFNDHVNESSGSLKV
jgi:hypothetical protein